MQERTQPEGRVRDHVDDRGAETSTSSGDDLLTPGEVARLFGVDPKTVTRWAAAGKLEALRTLGGHRRYRSSEVHRLLDGRSNGRSERHQDAAGNGTRVLERADLSQDLAS